MLPARELFSLGLIPITDGFLGSIIVTISMITFFYLAAGRFSIVPTRMQAFLEMMYEYVLGVLENAFRSKERAEKFLPFFLTMLIFLTVANQFTLVPFIFELTYQGGDLFRQPTSHFALPIALSLLVFVISHIMAFRISPIKHLSNFVNAGPLLKARKPMDFFTGAIEAFIGVLNVIGEVAKVVSLAARLFGNIFAGNVMVAVIIGLASFTQFIVPIPFIIISVFSGFVQAFVFMLLSIQYIAMAIDGATPEKHVSSPNLVA